MPVNAYTAKSASSRRAIGSPDSRIAVRRPSTSLMVIGGTLRAATLARQSSLAGLRAIRPVAKHHEKNEQPLGCEDVDVGMEGEVLAERLQGENQARRTLVFAGRDAHHVGDGAGGGAREIGEQAAVVAEVEPQALGDGENHLAMRDGEEDLFYEVGGGECGAAGGTGGAEPAAAAGD